jgi:hypothetical protein
MLIYFMAICNILQTYGIFYHKLVCTVFRFWYHPPRKIWQPCVAVFFSYPIPLRPNINSTRYWSQIPFIFWYQISYSYMYHIHICRYVCTWYTYVWMYDQFSYVSNLSYIACTFRLSAVVGRNKKLAFEYFRPINQSISVDWVYIPSWWPDEPNM